MTCPYPLKIASPEGGAVSVPCGRCVLCRIQKSREWTQRLLIELESHDWNGLFVTLTYRDSDCPDGLDKKALQKFFKRLRRDLGDRKIKYFACGEYGEKKKRPHYHIIVFGLWIDDLDLIEENWPHGFVKIGSVTYDSCRYVCDYTQKKSTNDYNIGLPPIFQLMSKGLGAEYMKKNIDKILKNKGIVINGRPAGFNRYFVNLIRKKYSSYESKLNEVLNDRKHEKRIDEMLRYGQDERRSFEDVRHLAKSQKLKSVLAKRALHAKKL